MASSTTAPHAVVAAAAAAILVAALDATDTIVAALSPAGTGAIGGTLLRDALLVAGGVFAMRRARWAHWLLLALFGLALLRATVADGWVEWAGVATAVAGLVLLLLPASLRWFSKESAAVPAT